MTAFATDKARSHDGSFTVSELNRRDADARDAAPMVTRCSHCDWTFEGPAGDGRAESQQHVMSEHPHLKSRNGKRPKSPAREEAMVAVEQRAAIATASAKREESPMQEAAPPPVPVADHQCKVDGCTNRTTVTRGRYAYLCADHRGTVAKRAASPKKRPASPKKTKGNVSNGKVKGRGRAELLGLLVTKQTEIEAANKHVTVLEQEFHDLADEFGKARA